MAIGKIVYICVLTFEQNMRDVSKILEDLLRDCNPPLDDKEIDELQKYLDKFVGEQLCGELTKDLSYIIEKGIEVWAVKNIPSHCMSTSEFVIKFLEIFCAQK